ncbi:MAG: hypothetical protein RLZZ57_2109 [Pseudomonadota bacterium]
MIFWRGAIFALPLLTACAETPAPAPNASVSRTVTTPAPTPSNLPTTGQAGTERAMSTLQQQLDQDRANERLGSYDPEAPRGDMSPPRTPYEIGGNTRMPAGL